MFVCVCDTCVVEHGKERLDETTAAHLVGRDGVFILQDHNQILQSRLHQVSPGVLSFNALHAHNYTNELITVASAEAPSDLCVQVIGH